MSLFYFYNNKMKSTIITNKLQLLDFGKIVVDIVVIIPQKTLNALEGSNFQALLSKQLPRITLYGNRMLDDNDKYHRHHHNIFCDYENEIQNKVQQK